MTKLRRGIKTVVCAIGISAAFFVGFVEASSHEEQWARTLFNQAKYCEQQRYYDEAIMFYKKVIDQVPGSGLAKRAQDRINQLRATPEMIAAAAKEADKKRKQAEARQAAKKKLEEYVEAHPEYKKEILGHQITIGMSEADVIESWGKPEHVNTTVTAYGRQEQWAYGYQYVYFQDGRVTAMQSSR